MRPASPIPTLIGLLCLAVCVAAPAGGPISIKFSHVVAPDTPKGKAALRFAELARERTQGRVQVTVYHDGSLYSDADELEALQLGAVQMLAPSLAKFGPLGIKEFEVFDLPYLFDNMQQLHAVTQGPIGREVLGRLAAKGMIGLAFWDNGFRVMSANRPLRDPMDFRGLKMRIHTSKVIQAQMRSLGAEPRVMPFSPEIYRALETGAVDGTENTPSNLYTQGFQEVQRYITVSNHSLLAYAVVVDKSWWEGLPPDIRTALEGAMKEATAYANETAEQENAAALTKLAESGETQIIALTPQEQAAWKARLVEVHRALEDELGRQLIRSIYRTTGDEIGRL